MIDLIVKLKNKIPFLFYIWSLQQKFKGIKNLKKYSDKEAIIKLYKDYSGKLPDLEKPNTFSEKLQWMKLNYQNPLMTICSDKWEVREYLTKKGYKALLSNVISVHDNIQDFHPEKLPKNFVVKATHGSGWNLICKDKEKIHWFWWKKIMNIWLTNNIFWPGREWPYKNMKPRLIVEEFLTDTSGQLTDYKFFCFNGIVKFVQANKGRQSNDHVQNFYDLNWKILPFGKNLEPRPDISIEPPFNLLKMSEIAKNLSKNFPFVRVDFYEVDRSIIFGEMTFFHGSGIEKFVPEIWNRKFGDLIEL